MAPPREDMEAEVELFLAGLSISEVARRRGVSRQAMWRALHRRGLVKSSLNRKGRVG